MRAVLRATVLAIAVLGGALAQTALATGPTQDQIRQAAEQTGRSGSVWATINVCDSHGTGHGGELGVRGQMPSLGVDSELRMTIHLSYWSQLHERFEAIPGPSGTSYLSLGTSSTGLQQAGMLYDFAGSTGLLAASIDFTWLRGGQVIGETSRFVTGGHPDADYGSPAQFSASQCRLG